VIPQGWLAPSSLLGSTNRGRVWVWHVAQRVEDEVEPINFKQTAGRVQRHRTLVRSKPGCRCLSQQRPHRELRVASLVDKKRRVRHAPFVVSFSYHSPRVFCASLRCVQASACVSLLAPFKRAIPFADLSKGRDSVHKLLREYYRLRWRLFGFGTSFGF